MTKISKHVAPASTKIKLELSKSIFEELYLSCEDRRDKLRYINQNSEDEDEIADAGNDILSINSTMKMLKREADNTWGEGNWSTSNDILLP